jgi:parvulin-like peptidyl-prolyl isomerase
MGIRVSEQDVDNYIQSVMQRSNLTAADLLAALQREGVNMEQYREQVRSQLERGELIERNVKKKVHITSEDLERYYNANGSNFATAEKVHLRHILLVLPDGASSDQEQAVLARIMDLRKQALDGTGFAQLARQYSEGAGAGEGGDIGWVDRSALLEELGNAAFALQAGEISQPVRTSLGYHLVKMEERKSSGSMPFDKVSEDIRKELYEKALQERFATWLKTDLRQKHRVEVKLPGYVFKAQQPQENTVRRLMASTNAAQETAKDKSFLDYINPLSYIIDQKTIPDEELGELSDRKVVSVFGSPLFVTEAGDDVDVPLDQPFPGEGGAAATAEPAENTDSAKESDSVLSNLWPF